MTPSAVTSQPAGWPSPVHLAAADSESVGAFAARLHAAATVRNLEARGWFGDRLFIARPGDTLAEVLAPFYATERW